MNKVICDYEDLVAIADAIRSKLDSALGMTIQQMKNKILSIGEDNDASVVVAINSSTNKAYSKIQTALNEASEGEIVSLNSNAEETIISVPKNVTLDLNSYTLNVSNITSLGNVIDSSEANTGIVIPTKGILLQKNNAQLPIKDGDGYRFSEVVFKEKINSSNKYLWRAEINPLLHNLILLGSTSSDVQFYIYDNYVTSKGNYMETVRPVSDTLVFAIINSYDSSTNKYGSSGLLNLATIDTSGYTDLKYHTLLKSSTGVELMSDGLEYVNTSE